MDRTWIQLNNRWSPQYVQGVKEFIAFSSISADKANRIRCPCRDCKNLEFHQIGVVRDHLFLRGMDRQYTRWVHHGENFETSNEEEDEVSNNDDMTDEVEDEDDEMHEILDDLHRGTFMENFVGQPSSNHDPQCSETNQFTRTLKDSQHPLYPGCEKFSKLSFLVKLFHIKTINGWSNKSFSMLLELLKEALPIGETLPRNHYEAKTIIRDLGLSYVRIHACKNDCVLFWKEHENLEDCPVCGHSRWVYQEVSKRRKVPEKVLRYFPLTPRLQRLFMSKKTAPHMSWHKDKRVVEENVLRHPADSKAWQKFDKDHDWFAQDSRNVRLGLASDGFNPFGNMSNAYSMWPVVLIPYNFPPWKCMKEPFFMMSLLIPGPKSPGNDIDVYLRPLIDELKELWENGVETYDSSKEQIFKLHAAVLWTINDFPAYANLSGWSTKGKLACPSCNKETRSLSLKHGRKTCYMGHRRFLPHDHNWRRKTTMFDGKQEHTSKPKELSGDDVLEQLSHINEVSFGKNSKNKRKRAEQELNWTKWSIFFELPYWKTLMVRHNLDVMHIEKNICDNVLGTLMNIEGKTKDTIKSRLDLELMGIRKELHLRREGTKFVVPPACFTLSKDEKREICEFIKTVKFPDGYAANIARCVSTKGCKISGLKSHDSHVFLQRLLPVVLRGYLRKDVSSAFIQLSYFFKELCCKTVKMDELDRLERDIALILCKFESILPPSFFDVMVHLAVHLPNEARLAGPVQYRWMYPIERFLRTLKCYVRNKARPEGSIAEAYIDNECLTFCSMYLHGVETRFNREERNYDGSQGHKIFELSIFAKNVRPLGHGTYEIMSLSELTKAHWYVLNNCEEVETYLEQHMDVIEKESPHNITNRHRNNFSYWFKEHMKMLRLQKSPKATDELYFLASGPDSRVIRYKAAIINGIRFHTIEREKSRRTQNSGVIVKGEHQSNEVDFYGVITDIIALTYGGVNRVFIFKCDWWDVGNKKLGIQRDDYFTSVNVARTWYKDDPYILASQAEQVFYVMDTKLGGSWRVVQKIQPRNLYDIIEAQDEEEYNPSDDEDAYQLSESNTTALGLEYNDEEVDPLHRDDMEPEYVDVTVIQNQIVSGHDGMDDAFIVEDVSDDDIMNENSTDEEDILDNDIYGVSDDDV